MVCKELMGIFGLPRAAGAPSSCGVLLEQMGSWWPTQAKLSTQCPPRAGHGQDAG